MERKTHEQMFVGWTPVSTLYGAWHIVPLQRGDVQTGRLAPRGAAHPPMKPRGHRCPPYRSWRSW